MDEILRRLTAIEALLYTITGLMLVMVTVFFALWSIVIQGRRPNIPQLFDMTTKAVKRGVYALDVRLQKRRKIKNMGQSPVVPDVDDAMLTRFYRKLKQMHDGGTDYKMTEDYWYPDIWQGIGGTSKEQMRKVFDRAEAAGVLKRGNPSAKNSTRVLASYAALRRLAG